MGEAEKNEAQLCSAERGGSDADAGLKAEQEAQYIRLGRHQAPGANTGRVARKSTAFSGISDQPWKAGPEPSTREGYLPPPTNPP